ELAGEGRRELHDHLERLRERGAEATGIAPPQLTRLWRISATNAGLAIGTLVAVAVLLGDVGDPAHVWATVRGAEWSWLLVALVPTTGLVELTIGVVIVVILATAVAMGVPALRRTVVPPLYRAATTIGTSLRSPRLLGLLIGGNVLAALLSTWCLQACLVAFG